MYQTLLGTNVNYEYPFTTYSSNSRSLTQDSEKGKASRVKLCEDWIIMSSLGMTGRDTIWAKFVRLSAVNTGA